MKLQLQWVTQAQFAGYFAAVEKGFYKNAGLDDAKYAAFLERSAQTHPLGRPGTADEVASLATFLVSDEASFITGGLHSIDGGRALTSLR